MENEILKQILAELQELKVGQSKLEAGQSKLETNIYDLKLGQQRIEKKLDVITDQTAFLTEFRTEVNNKLDEIQSDLTTLEAVSGKNLRDIASLKRAK